MKITRWLIPLVIVLCLLFPSRVAASDTEDKIKEYQQKIVELQGQEDSLSKQINLLNSQIALSGAKIEITEAAITKLESEIGDLDVEIQKLEELKTKRLELVLHRIPESYKRSRGGAFGALFLSKNFSDLLTRVKYLARVQAEDSRYYQELQLTQNNFNERKDQREKKKEQQEVLKQQLEAEVRQRDKQKKDKEVLLAQTRNSESVYQSLLAQALAEKQALDRALVDAVQVGPVKKGDPIALIGNTGYPGCSTGAHLHFEVRQGGGWVNPANYLSSRTVNFSGSGSGSMGSGSWDWPLEGNIMITQNFGQTPYSWQYKYSGGIHTGIDMTSSSSVIRAPKDGTLFSSSQNCGSSSIIKIKYIDHGDGIFSFYLHVQ